MKFTLSWLKEHLETKAEIDIIIDTLTNIGLEVENIEDKENDYKHFTIAKVISADKHPNADRLKVCKVETSKGNVQVVCGAPNAKSGMFGVFAPSETYIPGTNINLKKSEIRGVESNGMLLSERELGISDEHEGIIELTGKHKIGDPIASIYGFDDPVIEINLTPNRSDCLSVRGIARDLAAAGLGTLKDLKIKKIKGTFKSNIKWVRKFKKDEEYLCPGVAGRLFKNVKNKQSPEWLNRRLTLIGLRPISTLVDITNYVTFDLGRPLHVYDASKLSGNLVMRKSHNKEKCKTLDDKEYTLSDEMVVISDDKSLHGIGGVMGGSDSGCSENTTDVFLEVALFDPISVTKTGRKLNLQSDARYRFERGLDYTSIDWGVDIATQMILDLCGGESSEIVADKLDNPKSKTINFDTSLIKTYGGINISEDQQKKILEKLGFLVNGKDKKIFKITIPSFRPDIVASADIVEEILRIYGFDKIEPTSLPKDQGNKDEILSPNLKSFFKSRRLIANRGYLETVTWSFMDSKNADYLNNNSSIKIQNPISVEMDAMRPSTFPNLLNSINFNISKLFTEGKVFEVGPNFHGLEEEDQQMVATGIHYGFESSISWNNKQRAVDIYDVKSDVFYVLEQLNVPVENLQYDNIDNNIYHPGKSMKLRLGKNTLATFGEISPLLLNRFNIKTLVCGFEIYLDELDQFQTKKTSTKKSFDNNSLQKIERDFAFLFPLKIQSIDIINAVKKIDKKIIKNVIIFDVFEGKNLSDNKKSIAFKVTMQPQEKTFTDPEIENISNNIIDLISKSFDGELRQ
ncbi:phenylalanine--tRNA ligase subunit beta [Alphaproteobacteria bacterium]|nr:phenylalanine--tRNA ligase subunit beta [Alphaproteobacteria bacterium]